MIAYRVRYEGNVQGVGFRATSQRIARRFALSGHVRNLPDGAVELVVEGRQSVVQAFLVDVAAHFEGSIAHENREEIAATEVMDAFEILR